MDPHRGALFAMRDPPEPAGLLSGGAKAGGDNPWAGGAGVEQHLPSGASNPAPQLRGGFILKTAVEHAQQHPNARLQGERL
jgi:hypothetical protein